LFLYPEIIPPSPSPQPIRDQTLDWLGGRGEIRVSDQFFTVIGQNCMHSDSSHSQKFQCRLTIKQSKIARIGYHGPVRIGNSLHQNSHDWLVRSGPHPSLIGFATTCITLLKISNQLSEFIQDWPVAIICSKQVSFGHHL